MFRFCVQSFSKEIETIISADRKFETRMFVSQSKRVVTIWKARNKKKNRLDASNSKIGKYIKNKYIYMICAVFEKGISEKKLWKCWIVVAVSFKVCKVQLSENQRRIQRVQKKNRKTEKKQTNIKPRCVIFCFNAVT